MPGQSSLNAHAHHDHLLWPLPAINNCHSLVQPGLLVPQEVLQDMKEHHPHEIEGVHLCSADLRCSTDQPLHQLSGDQNTCHGQPSIRDCFARNTGGMHSNEDA